MSDNILNPMQLQRWHQSGLGFDDYLATGSSGQRRDWSNVYDAVGLSNNQRDLIGGFTRQINVIGVSGIWCGDCAQQCPLIQRIVDASSMIDLRWLDRDEHADLQKMVRINGGDRVPVVVFCSEDYELAGWFGDRTLNRYRALADSQLGPSCPLPGAPVPPHQTAVVLADWVDQFERIHLLLRLSPRLRTVHGD